MSRKPSLLLLGALLAAAPACVIEIGEWSGPRVQKDVELNHALSASITEVYVDGYNGSVTITEGPAGSVSGTSRVFANARTDEAARERLDSMRWNFEEQAGGRLLLKLSEPASGGHSNAGGSVTLAVPAAMRVFVDSSNGGVEVTGAFPYAWVDTSNGGVRVTGARSVEVDTSNGGVEIRGADGKVVADTSNGRVIYEGSSADFHFDSSNGGIEVTLTGDWSGKGHADTSNGNVRVECTGVMDCAMHASASNGKVRTSGPSLDSGRGSLRLDTSNGSITVEHGAGQ